MRYCAAGKLEPTALGKIRRGTMSAQPEAQARISAHPILQLQRTIGNHAVQRLLQSGRFQTKLAVSQPGDVYEQEADHVADQVMRISDPAIQRTCAPCAAGRSFCPKCKQETNEAVQRTVETPGSTDELTMPDDVVRGLGPGRPLDPSARAFFEPRFGADFSQVRVHTGPQAVASARAVNALAYTVGTNVVFNSGRYAPHRDSGRRLLAHELTHVVQQESDSSPEASGNETHSWTVSRSQGPLEMRTNRMAESYNWHKPPVGGLSHGILQRQAAPAAVPETPEAPRVCPVTAIAAFGPPDASPAGSLTAATQTALTCLQNAVTAAGGTMVVTTTYRSQAYQDHLVEVWDKVTATPPEGAECAAVRENYAQERATHFPMGEPARGVSNHTNGTAFDATVTLPPEANLNTIQAGCNLTRPVSGEPWHFET